MIVGRKRLPPLDVSEAITLWYRKYGRNARVEWVEPMNCFVIMVSLFANDPLLGAWRDGRLDGEQPTEDVFLHEPNPNHGKRMSDGRQDRRAFVPLDLHQMGVDGVIRFLEERNTFSGRGQFDSPLEAVKAAQERSVEGKAKHKEQAKQDAVDQALDLRRTIENIPLVGVGIDLTKPAA